MHIDFPPELPVSQRRDDIAAAIREHQVVILAGETGSGKTTQLPKICLELGRGDAGRLIGHTQPRRIAARSVAERIAEELGTTLGDLVGYQVRFTDKTSRTGRVKLMTDGILLAELQHDKLLRRYDTLIIDEAHERSLNIDFVLGYLHRLLPKRPGLKLIITSATIDPGRFARHFGDAPVIEVSGRTYPVEVRYRPLVEESYDDDEGEPVVRDQTEAILDAVRELGSEGDGDVLVFLPGEREIRDTADALAKIADGPRSAGGGFDVLPLYSRLSAAEQHRVFAKHGRRRVVLATNVAETSLTVPGIRYVVDTGLARISRYSLRTKVQRLPIEPISQASASQRAGRCGRVADGICIRLYAEEEFLARPEFTEPEILRTSLASVILQMIALGLGDVAGFPFLDPPDQRNVRAGVALLEELGALRSDRSANPGLTGIGRRLARLPIDPRLGRMILEAERLGCLREVLVVAAALSIQDPRERPAEHRARADQLHARFRDDRSDFLAWLNLWGYLKEQQRDRGSSSFRRMCREEHLNYLRVREWQDFESQLRQVAKRIGLSPGKPAAQPDADRIHQALLSGLLSHIGLKEVAPTGSGARPRGASGRRPLPEYQGARGAKFAIFPGSGLARRQPDFVMAAELVETSRLWGRQNAAIDPAWAERLGEHLVRRTFSEPHWSKKRAATMAYERVTLYGVPLVADRLVTFTQDCVLARELFIRHALVYGEWHSRHGFLEDNRRLLEQAEELEHRARRRGIVVDEHTLFEFYDARVGPEVVSGVHFDTWWKQERRHRPDQLTFDPAMLVHEGVDAVDDARYPDVWQEGALSLPLSYRFEPGTEHDGVTVEVPLATLNQVGAAAFTWQVPGLREELVTALIRSLPKPLRVHFVPAPDVARTFLSLVPPGEEGLTEALARHLLARTGVLVPPEAWDWAKVPEHLRARFRVVDGEGAVLAEGRDLNSLKHPLRPGFEAAVAQVAEASGIARSGARTWVFGHIEDSFTQVRAGHQVQGFPALDDEGDTVGLRVVGSADEQEARHRFGVRRLLRLNVVDPAKSVLDGLDNAGRLGLAGSPYPTVAGLLEDCVLAVLGDLVDAVAPVRDPASYDALLGLASDEVEQRTRALVLLVTDVLSSWRAAQRDISGRVELAMLPAMSDLGAQLGSLVRPGFVADAGVTALRNYPRYLGAVAQRVERLQADPQRDRILMAQVAPLQEAWQHRADALAAGRPQGRVLREVRWLLEEYRVSLFAQRLGTAVPVSDARIRKALG